jgi:ubiquinol-cytochrome c reductase iron-sulfur subunit
VVEPANANPNADHAHSASPADGSSRRDFIHVAAIAVAGVGAVATVWPFIDQMNPSADTLALASIEYDFSKVAVGSQASIKWRGKPVFVRHRTPKEIADAVADDHASMRDPAVDASRHKPGKAEWLILIGVCTHLGCVPNLGGTYGGWLCPCHGSVYDTAGRIRAGPAPLNLPMPDYEFISPTKVKIG